jgi:hypothetical protein
MNDVCHVFICRSQTSLRKYRRLSRKTLDMTLADISKWIAVAFASVAFVSAAPNCAELSPGVDTHSQSSGSQTTSTRDKATSEALTKPTSTLSDAQIEALLREIGLRNDSRGETAPTPETKPSLSQSTTVLSDAQTEALLTEMGIWYHNRADAAPRPASKPLPTPQAMSRRHWPQYSGHASADRGEATRLMMDELRQSGIATDTASVTNRPK